VNILKRIGASFVFCYHRVVPKEVAKAQIVHRALYVTPDTLERHIRWMVSVGDVVGISQILEKSRSLRFMITFDDGWSDNYTYALPILRRYGVPAIIFISTDNIDRKRLFWSEEIGMLIQKSPRSAYEVTSALQSLVSRAMELIVGRDRKSINTNWRPADHTLLLDRFIECMKVLPVDVREEFLDSFYSKVEVSPHTIKDLLLSWEQISIMKAQGITFGSHTHTHPILDRMGERAIESELWASKQVLERHLGESVSSFSYPNGCYKNIHIQKSLGSYGFKYAFTLERSPVSEGTDPLLIPRCLVYEDIAGDLEGYCTRVLIKTCMADGLDRAKRLFLGHRYTR
jgi:peptidoglycan/xylan/chitin deacetylase (PgdA/CDA1 family)